MTTSFALKLCTKLFIECFSMVRALPGLLNEEEGLGAHTGVVLLARTFGVTYFLCNKNYRPMGVKIPLQCPECLAVKTLRGAPGSPGYLEVLCVGCKSGWKLEAPVTVRYPEEANGWARQFVFGGDDEYGKVWNAPRSQYDTL